MVLSSLCVSVSSPRTRFAILPQQIRPTPGTVLVGAEPLRSRRSITLMCLEAATSDTWWTKSGSRVALMKLRMPAGKGVSWSLGLGLLRRGRLASRKEITGLEKTLFLHMSDWDTLGSWGLFIYCRKSAAWLAPKASM